MRVTPGAIHGLLLILVTEASGGGKCGMYMIVDILSYS